MADEKKSWLDEKVDAAKERAAAEAGKAMVSGIAAAAEKQLDGWLGAMEGELARRQGGATAPASPGGADPTEAPAPPGEGRAQPRPPGPTAEERQSAAAAELVRMKAQARRAPQVDLVDDPVAPPAEVEVEAEVEELEELSAEAVEDEPAPPEAASYVPHVEPWVRPDPMAAAQAALEKARQVRRGAGLPEPEEPVRATVSNPRDPFAAANAALERAQAARATVGRSASQVEREERARKELELLKGGRGGAPADPGAAPHDEPAPPATGPRRRL